jgi:hypothetical protein
VVSAANRVILKRFQVDIEIPETFPLGAEAPLVSDRWRHD